MEELLVDLGLSFLPLQLVGVPLTDLLPLVLQKVEHCLPDSAHLDDVVLRLLQDLLLPLLEGQGLVTLGFRTQGVVLRLVDGRCLSRGQLRYPLVFCLARLPLPMSHTLQGLLLGFLQLQLMLPLRFQVPLKLQLGFELVIHVELPC